MRRVTFLTNSDACSTPSHCLNVCSLILNQTIHTLSGNLIDFVHITWPDFGSLSQVPLLFHFFLVFQHCINTCYLLNVTFIFDRCNHGLSVLALIKYKCDLMNLISTFARLKIYLTEKLAHGCFVNPATPERPHKPHNASAPCPTVRHSEQKYTYTVLNAVLWDLWDWSMHVFCMSFQAW